MWARSIPAASRNCAQVVDRPVRFGFVLGGTESPAVVADHGVCTGEPVHHVVPASLVGDAWVEEDDGGAGSDRRADRTARPLVTENSDIGGVSRSPALTSPPVVPPDLVSLVGVDPDDFVGLSHQADDASLGRVSTMPCRLGWLISQGDRDWRCAQASLPAWSAAQIV